MLWRLVVGGLRPRSALLGAWSPRLPRPAPPVLLPARRAGDYIPPTQYDTPPSPKFQLGHVVRCHWEIIPVLVTTVFTLLVVLIAIIWACKNKMDLVFTTHSRENISRTMNLREPTCHKMLTINQLYEPWPDMQLVLDKMKYAEKRAEARKLACTYP